MKKTLLSLAGLLFLAALAVWLRDESPGQTHARDVLRHRLADADRAMVRVWGKAAPPGAAEAA